MEEEILIENQGIYKYMKEFKFEKPSELKSFTILELYNLKLLKSGDRFTEVDENFNSTGAEFIVLENGGIKVYSKSKQPYSGKGVNQDSKWILLSSSFIENKEEEYMKENGEKTNHIKNVLDQAFKHSGVSKLGTWPGVLKGKPRGIDCHKFNSKPIIDTNKEQAIEDTNKTEKVPENVSKWLNPEDAPINMDVLMKFKYRSRINRIISYKNSSGCWTDYEGMPLENCEIIGWMYLPK